MIAIAPTGSGCFSSRLWRSKDIGVEAKGEESCRYYPRLVSRHQVQFTGQFLVDRHGIVRWAHIECARDGLAGIDKFPTDEELLAAPRAL